MWDRILIDGDDIQVGDKLAGWTIKARAVYNNIVYVTFHERGDDVADPIWRYRKYSVLRKLPYDAVVRDNVEYEPVSVPESNRPSPRDVPPRRPHSPSSSSRFYQSPR